MTVVELALLGLAAAGAGAVNALAGGGTLISFPVLLAMGVPPIAANITNAVALCPGYFGATLAQRRNLQDQIPRLWICLPAAIIGGLIGAIVLVNTHERVFQSLVPYMLMTASLLLAAQDRVRTFVIRRAADGEDTNRSTLITALVVLIAGIYGGFFSAGMSVILLAVLALTIDDTLTRLNALKQIAAFSVNVAAAVFFMFSDHVIWSVVAVMAIGALCGGAIGGRIAGKLNPSALRWIVVCVGIALAIYYWVKG